LPNGKRFVEFQSRIRGLTDVDLAGETARLVTCEQAVIRTQSLIQLTALVSGRKAGSKHLNIVREAAHAVK